MTSSRIYGRSSRRRKIYPEEGIAMFHKASLQAVPSEHLPAAHALRGPLPGIGHDLRLDDAGGSLHAATTATASRFHRGRLDLDRKEDDMTGMPNLACPLCGSPAGRSWNSTSVRIIASAAAAIPAAPRRPAPR
jgi:hypothetical protein